MVTIHRAHGLRIIIFTDDHEPAHVPVFGVGQARINPIGPDAVPALVWAKGMKANDPRRAMQIVRDEQAALERGRIAQQTTPRAASARYDRKGGRIIVELTNDCTLPFHPAWRRGWKARRMTILTRSKSLVRGAALGSARRGPFRAWAAG